MTENKLSLSIRGKDKDICEGMFDVIKQHILSIVSIYLGVSFKDIDVTGSIASKQGQFLSLSLSLFNIYFISRQN